MKTFPNLERTLMAIAAAVPDFDIVIKRNPQKQVTEILSPAFDKKKWKKHKKSNP